MVTLERLRWWHIDELLPIEADLFGPEQWSAGMFWNELASGHHYVVAVEHVVPGGPVAGVAPVGGPVAGVAPVGGPVLGYGGLAVYSPDEAWVQNIAVRRDAQRRGIGRLLLEALLAEARRRRIGTTLLEVATDNAPAQKLYDRYGFEGVGVRKGYYQPSNTDALVMRRDEVVV